MRQTLFLIPQSWLEGPLFLAWLVIGLAILVCLVARHGWGAKSLEFLPMFAIIAAMLYFVAPRIGIYDINPADPNGPEIKVGLAIRGYGMMMVLGIFSGIGLAICRGRRHGFNTDKITMLAFWMCVCGVVGARLFYVIQKRDHFDGKPLEMLVEMLNMTQGGLVVYGSLIGASLGGAIYAAWTRVPILRVADIIAPSMLVGLAFGRIGCLLNGCCFGGVCDLPELAQKFPAGAPPYLRQLETGELLGIESGPVDAAGPDLASSENPNPSSSGGLLARSVRPDSLAERAGVKAGDQFQVDYPSHKVLRAVKQDDLPLQANVGVIVRDVDNNREEDRYLPINAGDLPEYSLGVYPTQIIAAINAAILAALLWFYFPFRRRDGQVFALLIILYSVTRFLLELIRRDEYGQFGTELTISQWVSVIVILGGFLLFAFAPERRDFAPGHNSGVQSG